MDKISYALGLSMAMNFKATGMAELSLERVNEGIEDAYRGEKSEMDLDEARQIMSNYFAKLQLEADQKNKEAGLKFLEENKKKEGVQVTASGLQYQVLTMGEGDKPKATSTVRCHYEGCLIDGSIFDSSYKRNQPADFPVNQVIPGWTEALQLMPVGSKWRLFIPSELGYGEHGAGDMIAPNSVLIFDVELLDIVK